MPGLAYIYSPRTDGKPGAHHEVWADGKFQEPRWYQLEQYAQEIGSFGLRFWAETHEDMPEEWDSKNCIHSICNGRIKNGKWMEWCQCICHDNDPLIDRKIDLNKTH